MLLGGVELASLKLHLQIRVLKDGQHILEKWVSQNIEIATVAGLKSTDTGTVCLFDDHVLRVDIECLSSNAEGDGGWSFRIARKVPIRVDWRDEEVVDRSGVTVGYNIQ